LAEKVILQATLAKVPLGKHIFEALLETKQGKKLSSLRMELKKLKPLAKGTETKILLREGGSSIVLVNGKPLFPLGLFFQRSHSWEDDLFAEGARAGFTHMIHWTRRSGAQGVEDLKRMLDIAQKEGFYVVGWGNMLAQSPDQREGLSYAMSTDKMRSVLVECWLPQLAEAIPRVAGHPALMGWRVFDEVPARHVSNNVLLAEKLREIDPYHNQYFSTEGGNALTIAARGGELNTHDNYVSDSEPMTASFYKALLLKEQCGRLNNRVPIVVPQLSLSTALRFLRYEEQRCHSFLAVIAGAKGLEWFIDRPSLLGPWNELKKIVGQIRQLSPVLLEPDIEQNFSIGQKASSPIYARLFKKGRDHYLIAANSTIHPTSACFKIQGLRDNTKAKEVFDSTRIDSKGDELTLEFGPYEVLVYRMTLNR